MQTSPPSSGHFNPAMLTLARESRGLTQAALARLMQCHQSRVSKLESGTMDPSADIITDMSRALDYPAEFFYASDTVHGPGTSEFYHRKRSSVPAKLMNQIYAHANIRFMHLRRLMRAVELPENIPRMDIDEFEGDAGEIARAVRAAWQIPRGPVKDVIALIEAAGGIVLRVPFGTRKVDAVSQWPPDTPPLFLINASMPADRERLTICHELGHLIMHRYPNPHMEDQANRFAAAFLMPDDEVHASLRGASLRTLASLKPYWRVSMQALLRKARDTGAITPARAKYLWVQMSKAGYLMREPAELDFPKERPGVMQEVIDLHINDLGYSINEMSRALVVGEREFREMYGAAHEPAPRLRRIK